MTGDPARVFESGEGKASGRTLTFFIGDERLLVEGPQRGIHDIKSDSTLPACSATE